MPPQLAYTPLERLRVPRPVDRIEYLRRACVGKVVIDLGAMDETAYPAKRGTGTWVHEEIAKVATRVIGIDSSLSVPTEGLRTGERSVIYRADTQMLAGLVESLQCEPDLIVAGELIEHLPNPLKFLQSIRELPFLRGKTLLITTPNATALHNALIALTERESTHPDHLCILSFKTLNTLFMRAGFADWEILPYYSRFTEMEQRLRGLQRLLVTFSERTINVGEWLFPMLAFGWVVKAKA